MAEPNIVWNLTEQEMRTIYHDYQQEARGLMESLCNLYDGSGDNGRQLIETICKDQGSAYALISYCHYLTGFTKAPSLDDCDDVYHALGETINIRAYVMQLRKIYACAMFAIHD